VLGTGGLGKNSRQKAGRRLGLGPRDWGLGISVCGLGADKPANQMAKGKWQTVFHLLFAPCHLNFEFLLPLRGRGPSP
jgi:hypothetical protein